MAHRLIRGLLSSTVGILTALVGLIPLMFLGSTANASTRYSFTTVPSVARGGGHPLQQEIMAVLTENAVMSGWFDYDPTAPYSGGLGAYGGSLYDSSITAFAAVLDSNAVGSPWRVQMSGDTGGSHVLNDRWPRFDAPTGNFINDSDYFSVYMSAANQQASPDSLLPPVRTVLFSWAGGEIGNPSQFLSSEALPDHLPTAFLPRLQIGFRLNDFSDVPIYFDVVSVAIAPVDEPHPVMLIVVGLGVVGGFVRRHKLRTRRLNT